MAHRDDALDSQHSGRSESEDEFFLNRGPEVVQGSYGAIIRLTSHFSTIRRIHRAKFWRHIQDVLLVRDRSFDIYCLESEAELRFMASQKDLDGIIISSLALPESIDSGVHEQDPDLDMQDGYLGFCLSRQILVLILQQMIPSDRDRRYIIFTFPFFDQTMKVKFASYQHALPEKDQDTMGTHMAAEPKGRLLAVGSRTGAVVLYKLDPWETFRDEMEQSAAVVEDKFLPITEERSLELEGNHIIWHLDFVSSPKNEQSLAYLVVIAENTDSYVMFLCKIDCTKLLAAQTLQMIRQDMLGDILGEVLFLIPLKSVPGVIMGAEDRLVLIHDIRQARPVIHMYPTGVEKESEVRSGPRPLYNIWTRPSYAKVQRTDSDDDLIYLAREDGHILLLTIPSSSARSSDRQTGSEISSLGCLGFNVDKAFAIIDLPEDDWPTFITGGSHSNGAIVHFKSSRLAELDILIPNTDPIIDTALVPCRSHAPDGQKRVFVTGGRGNKHGVISEIRYGYANRVLESISTTNSTTNSLIINKAWILPHNGQDYLVTAAVTGEACQLYRYSEDLAYSQQGSHSDSTKIVFWFLVDRGSNPWFSIFDDGEETIAITLTRHGYFIRVTRSAIQQVSSDLTGKQNLLPEKVEDFTIMSAFIDSYDATVLFVTAQNASYSLHYLTTHDNLSLRSQVLLSEPSCLYLHNEEHLVLAILSTQEGNLEFYGLSTSEMSLFGTHRLGTAYGACETLTVLGGDAQSLGQDHTRSLLCGFRSGLLIYFEIAIIKHSTSTHAHSITLTQRDSISLGPTSVQVIPYYSGVVHHTAATWAFIFCEETFYIFKEDGNDFNATNLRQLWYTDLKNKGVRQSSMLWLATIPPWIQSTNLSYRDIFCVTRDEVHWCQLELDDEPRNIPWQISVGGSPNRIIWSDHHKRLVVSLSLELTIDTTQPPESKDGKPCLFSAIMIVDPNRDTENQIKLEEDTRMNFDSKQSTYAAIIDPSGDQISSLAEWEVSYNSRTYHMLLVSILEDASGGGKIHIFNFKAADEPLKLKATYRARNKGPIFAVAVYDSTSIIVLTHHYLIQLRLSSESNTIHFRETMSMELNSPSTRHLRIHEQQIIIGTETHGLESYIINDGEFVRYLTDESGGLSYDSITLSVPGRLTKVVLQVRHLQTQQSLTSQISVHDQEAYRLCRLFPTRVPSYIISLQQTSIRPLLRHTHHLRCPRITAFALDGKIYSIDMIDLDVWRVLKFMQNLIQGDSTLCPFNAVPVQLRRQIPHAHDREHIDSDVLRRLLEMDEPAARDYVEWLIGDRFAGLMKEWLVYIVGEPEIERAGGIAAALIALLRTTVNAP